MGCSKKGLPWCWHQSRGVSWPQLDGMWRWWGSLVIFEQEFEVIISVVIFLIVWGRFPHYHPCQLLWTCRAEHVNTWHLCWLWNSQGSGPRWQCVVWRWFTTIPSFWPSFLHHRQKVSPLHHHRASGEWMPFRHIILVTLGIMSLKKWMFLEEDLASQVAAWRFLMLPQLSCTLWILVPRRLAEVAICWNVLERSSNPSCSKLGQWVL